jgi:hypothetical protein
MVKHVYDVWGKVLGTTDIEITPTFIFGMKGE